MKYKKVKLKDIIFFNPKETIKKNQLAKKIPMDALIPFTRKVGYYEVKEFNSGTKFRNNDTLMARITPCLENGKTAYVNILNEDEIAFGSTEYFVLRADENYILPKYLYYISISDKLRNVAIKSMTGTSGRQRAQKESILDFEIELPSISIQKKVLSILDSIDSKIELNNQIISNLEELASTLFKRWFVEFEFPDENGNPYKSSGGKMVYSELGEIPEEWEIIKLSDLVVQIKETFNPNKTEVEKVNHFSIPNFDSK
ncbi:TPA: restriction endonuclease subunit S, partial [Enterococcus faecium]|nr:restriction endonuclease subunit S [Enterococcus faecium]HAR1454421.1 restriction endonuclease subunit S [Enterococcus faecium]HAR1457093.1 restriction endonuclease subunit S [Enterococcus faecium]HAR1462622.1 restriction endonuclease subunit S [Enterococcus faecium]HAR1465615.1 restriction endonuclease subunit S [Enterococcus faecium]